MTRLSSASLFAGCIFLSIAGTADAQIRWTTEERGSQSGGYDYYLKEMQYWENGKCLWQIPVPPRMRTYSAESSHEHEDINRYASPHFLLAGTLVSRDIVAVSDRSGLLVLSRPTGKILQDFPYPTRATGGLFWFDAGSYLIDVGGETATGSTKGATFIATCGGYVIHFSGSALYVLSARDGKLLERVEYDDKKHEKTTSLGRGRRRLEMKAKLCSLFMEGQIFFN